MKTVDEWKTTLRARLRVALVAKDTAVLAVVRETLAAIDNAEAAPISSAPTTVHGAFAGSAGGLGAGEVDRLVLAPEAVAAILDREIRERREAAAAYVTLGRHAEATALSHQANVLAELVATQG